MNTTGQILQTPPGAALRVPGHPVLVASAGHRAAPAGGPAPAPGHRPMLPALTHALAVAARAVGVFAATTARVVLLGRDGVD